MKHSETSVEAQYARMGNKTTSKVRGVGTVRIKNEDGSMFLLTGVRYIPEMDRNLLSVGTMEELGYIFESKERILSIHKDNKIVLKGKRHGKLYFLEEKQDMGQSYATEKRKDDTVLWHRRL